MAEGPEYALLGTAWSPNALIVRCVTGRAHPRSDSIAIHLADGWRSIRVGAVGIVVARAAKAEVGTTGVSMYRVCPA